MPAAVMWCSRCRQNVSAIASGELARCPQCGFAAEAVHAGTRSPLLDQIAERGIDLSGSTAQPAPISSIEKPLAADDSWLLDEQVRHLQRRMHVPHAAPASQTIADHADWSVDMASSDFW